MRLLLTRPEEDSADLVQELEAKGHEAVIFPLLTVEFTPISLHDADACKAVIVTSKNALRSLTLSAEALAIVRQRALYVTGPGTAALAHSLGFGDIRQGPGTAASLPGFIWETLGAPGTKLTYLAGSDTAFDLETALKAWDYKVHKIIAYRAKPTAQLSSSVEADIRGGRVDGVILMSPRTAAIFVQLIRAHSLEAFAQKLHYYCLSPNIAAKLEDIARKYVKIAVSPNIPGLLGLIEKDGIDKN